MCGPSIVRLHQYRSVYYPGMLVPMGDRGHNACAHVFQRSGERTPDYSTRFATASTRGCVMIVELRVGRHSAGSRLAAIPSLSSAEAAQATTTARVSTGERPRRVARVTMRRGPCRRTSASAITRLTGGTRSSAGLGARMDTIPFLDVLRARVCGLALSRNAG